MGRPISTEVRKHVWLMVSEREHSELREAAVRLQLPVAALCRQAIGAYLVSILTYFYVQTEDGTIVPPANEVGFTEFNRARLVAVELGGQVVMRQWQPTEDSTCATSSLS